MTEHFFFLVICIKFCDFFMLICILFSYVFISCFILFTVNRKQSWCRWLVLSWTYYYMVPTSADFTLVWIYSNVTILRSCTWKITVPEFPNLKTEQSTPYIHLIPIAVRWFDCTVLLNFHIVHECRFSSKMQLHFSDLKGLHTVTTIHKNSTFHKNSLAALRTSEKERIALKPTISESV
jgi:hypothetical protein